MATSRVFPCNFFRAVSTASLALVLASCSGLDYNTDKDGPEVLRYEYRPSLELVPYLAAALKSAGPKEDVTFALTGSHGLLGKFSPKTVTTGRVFVRDQRLNIIFGVVHDPFAILQMQAPSVPQPFILGTRAKRIDTRLAIKPGKGRIAAGDRPDWVTFDAARTE